jgi:hypothetical protein
MAAIGAFARSEGGAVYAAVCERYGLDPAAGFTDDLLAFNLRAALLGSAPKALDTETDEWAIAAAENERAWLGG